MPDDPTTETPTRASLQPRPTMTAGQLLADNLSTRMRELGAFASLLALAKWGLIPGTWAAIVIGLIVLPIEITRQVLKVPLARVSAATGGGAAAVLGVVVLHKALTYGAVAGVVLATMQGCGTPDQRTAAVNTAWTIARGARAVCTQVLRWVPAGPSDSSGVPQKPERAVWVRVAP